MASFYEWQIFMTELFYRGKLISENAIAIETGDASVGCMNNEQNIILAVIILAKLSMNFSQANAVSLKVKIIQRGPVHRLCKMALKRQKSLTYIHTGDPFKLSMCFNESGTISAKYLLDTGSGKFHRWDHDLLIFRGCRPLTILVGVTTFKLSHLLKSIVTLASSTLGFRVGVLISSTHS